MSAEVRSYSAEVENRLRTIVGAHFDVLHRLGSGGRVAYIRRGTDDALHKAGLNDQKILQLVCEYGMPQPIRDSTEAFNRVIARAVKADPSFPFGKNK